MASTPLAVVCLQKQERSDDCLGCVTDFAAIPHTKRGSSDSLKGKPALQREETAITSGLLPRPTGGVWEDASHYIQSFTLWWWQATCPRTQWQRRTEQDSNRQPADWGLPPSSHVESITAKRNTTPGAASTSTKKTWEKTKLTVKKNNAFAYWRAEEDSEKKMINPAV